MSLKLKKHYNKEINKPIGKKNPCWRGGITPVTMSIRNSNKCREWRQQVFIRDSFTCQKCRQIGGDLEAHHIKSFKLLVQEAKKYMPLLTLYDAAMLYLPLWDISNGQTLCKKCHPRGLK